MENLPSEILSIIFSFLDKKSRKSATASCQLWLDVIRNSNSSSHICYKRSFQELQQRIKNLEWDWKRWPALKTFELKGYSFKSDLLNDFSIEFKKCPNLEVVIFDVYIDIADLFPNCPRNAIIDKLTFNPQLDITQFGAVDQILSLSLWGQKPKNEVFKMINENGKGLKELTIDKISYLDNLVCMNALLKLRIMDHSSPELKIAGLKKLKTLKVCTLAQIDNLVSVDALLELSVTNVSGRELKEYDLSNITKCFKNLQKCEIFVTSHIDLIQPKEYAQIVQVVFQNSATRVKIVIGERWVYCSPTYTYTYLTKEPFQRCVVK